MTTSPVLRLSGTVVEGLGSLSNWPTAWFLLAFIQQTPATVLSVGTKIHHRTRPTNLGLTDFGFSSPQSDEGLPMA